MTKTEMTKNGAIKIVDCKDVKEQLINDGWKEKVKKATKKAK